MDNPRRPGSVALWGEGRARGDGGKGGGGESRVGTGGGDSDCDGAVRNGDGCESGVVTG